MKWLKQKSTWAGIAGFATGVALIIAGDVATGVQTAIAGVSVIFLREAIAKK